MNTQDTQKKTRHCLEEWRKQLDAHQATPMILLGVCHGQEPGRILLSIEHAMTDQAVIDFLERSLFLIKSRPYSGIAR